MPIKPILLVSLIFVTSLEGSSSVYGSVTVGSLVDDNTLCVIEWYDRASMLGVVFGGLKGRLNGSVVFVAVDVSDQANAGLISSLEEKLKLSPVTNSITLINSGYSKVPFTSQTQPTTDGILTFLKSSIPTGARPIRTEQDYTAFLSSTVPYHRRKTPGPHYKGINYGFIFLGVTYNQSTKIQFNAVQNYFWDTLHLAVIDMQAIYSNQKAPEWLKRLGREYNITAFDQIIDIPGGLYIGGKVEVVSSEAAPYMVGKVGTVTKSRKRGRVDVTFAAGELDPAKPITKPYAYKRLRPLSPPVLPTFVTLLTPHYDHISTTEVTPVYTSLQAHLLSVGLTPSPSLSAPPKKPQKAEVITFAPYMEDMGLVEEEDGAGCILEGAGVGKAATEMLSSDVLFEKM